MSDLYMIKSDAREQFLEAATILLLEGTSHERATAAGVLGALGNGTHIPALLHVLRSDDSRQVRHKTSRALARIGGEDALEGLRSLMAEQDQYTRFLAAEALSHIMSHGGSND